MGKMISDVKILLSEIAIFAVMAAPYLVNYFLHLDIVPIGDGDFANSAPIVESICQNLLDLNAAIVIALLISMVTGKLFNYRGDNLTTIARHSLYLVLTNSILMSLYPSFGRSWIAISMVVPTFTGNIVKLISIAKHVLSVV